jgi:hypothetical protein
MTTVTESIGIDAEPWRVYDLIADVAGVGEHSPEATGAFGAHRLPTVGDRFWGRNRRGPVVWLTQCRVTAARRGSEFAFDVGVGPVPLSHWSYRIEPSEGGGCVVTQSWTDRRDGVRGTVATRVGSVLIPGPRDEHNRRNIRASLAGLKRRAEAI